MATEIEAQIINIDYGTILDKIKELGAEKEHDWIKFKIAVFSPCLSKEDIDTKYKAIFTRVRDEGRGTITITTKVKKHEDKFPAEYEIATKNSFEECKNLLLANHLKMRSYQERLRQKWKMPKKYNINEVVFDIWPGLPLYMEIEAGTEEDLNNFIKLLDIDKKDIRYSGASKLYHEILGVEENIINNVDELTFETVENKLNEHVTNKDDFKKILSKQNAAVEQINNKLNGTQEGGSNFYKMKYLKYKSKYHSIKNKYH